MANKVRLTICGSSYVISTNESEDYMQNLAERQGQADEGADDH